MAAFPLDLLPASLKEAIQAQAAMGGYPVEAIAPAALAVTSFATQALANVEALHTPNKTFPLSNLFMIIARSGDAKSSQFEQLMKGIYAWQDRQLDVFDDETRRYQVAKTLWDRDTVKAEKAGDETGLLNLKANPPVRPSDPRNILSKSTTNGVYSTLEKGWPSMGMFTSEGGAFTGGHSLRAENSPAEFASMMTLLWDGSPIDRTTGEMTMRLKGRRMSGLIMVQSEVVSDFLNNPLLKAQGLHARFLIATPPPYVPPLADFVSDTEIERKQGLSRKIEPFNRRIEELLSHPLVTFGADKRELRPVAIGYTLKARQHLQDWFNTVARKWRMEETETFFGRALEHAQRLAGSMAVFEEWHNIKASLDNDADVQSKLDYWSERSHQSLPVIDEVHVIAATAVIEWFAGQLLDIDVPATDARDTRHAVHIDRIMKYLKKKGEPASARDIGRGPMQRIDSHLRTAVLQSMVDDDYVKLVEVTTSAGAKSLMYSDKQ